MPGTAALLIDLENFYIGREEQYHRSHSDDIYEFPIDLDLLCNFASDIADHRRLIVRRAYANFNDRRPGDGDRRWDYYLQPQPRFLMEQGIEPMQVFRFPGGSNKNAADMRLAMDATALLSAGSPVELFIIVTGDSDFIPLVLELRRHGAEVVVIGVTGCTKPIFARYCDRFEYFEDLLAARELQTEDHRDLQPVREALSRMLGRRAPIKFAAVKPLLSNELDNPFDPTRYGTESTGDFLRRFADALDICVRRGEHDWEIDKRGTGGGGDDDDDAGDEARAVTERDGGRPTGALDGLSGEHTADLYRDLLRQGIPRCYVVEVDDWNMILDAMFDIVSVDGAPAVVYHQELLTEVTEICSEKGMSEAPRKVRDVAFQLFKSGCFHCADEGAAPDQSDFHWSRPARLDPALDTKDKVGRRAWGYLLELLSRRLEQRGLGPTVQRAPLVDLLAGGDPSTEYAVVIDALLAERG